LTFTQCFSRSMLTTSVCQAHFDVKTLLKQLGSGDEQIVFLNFIGQKKHCCCQALAPLDGLANLVGNLYLRYE
jgi:hypothetical protein